MRRRLIIVSVLTVAAMALVGWLALGRLPAGAQLPTHWGPDGRPDRFAAADIALFMPAAIAAAVALLMAALPAIEPMQHRMERSAGLYQAAWAGLLAVMAIMQVVVVAPAFGWSMPAATPLIAIGLLFVVIGNALPKSRPGFFVGIRTPWAMIDPENWIATHRYGSKIMTAAGLGIVSAALLPIDGEARGSLVTAAILVTVVTPVLYSYLIWRRTRPG